MRRSRKARVVAAMAGMAAGAALIASPPTDDTGRPREAEVAVLMDRFDAALARAGARPPFRPHPVPAVGLAGPPVDPPPGYGPLQTVTGPAKRWPLAFADGALPFSYEVDPELADRGGLADVVRAMSAWDGVAGSRWRTRLARVSRRPLDEAYADGVSTVYLRKRCRAGLLGSVRWQLDPSVAAVDVRGGTGAVFTSEVDIAVCPRADTPEKLRRTLLHEVGHVMGLEHLCAPGRRCAVPEGGTVTTDPACRVMHWRLRPCGAAVRAPERDLARHLYPTLPRLWGPDATRAAVRASYATVPTQTARRVVLAAPGTHPWLLAPVLLEAAPDDAPLLLAAPDLGSCVLLPAAAELPRAAAPAALVTLVGAWPPSCERVLARWGLRVERRPAAPDVTSGATARPPPGNGAREDPRDPAAAMTGVERMAVQLAQADRVLARLAARGTPARDVVIAPLPSGLYGGGLTGEETALSWSAAALAARLRAPLLHVSGPGLPSAVAAWLRERPALRAVHVVGGVGEVHPAVLLEARRLGLTASRFGGVRAPHVTASTLRVFPGAAPVFVAGTDAPGRQAIAAALAMRTGGGMAVVRAAEAQPLAAHLRVRRPRGGALVAGPDQVHPQVHWALTREFRAAEDPRLDVERRFARAR